MKTLAVFARPPVAGQTKTRLGATVGAEQAAELAKAFLVDTLATCARVEDVVVELWWSKPDFTHPDLAAAVSERTQPEGDLGARMRLALSVSTAHGARACVVGSDSPTLPSRLLSEAFAALDEADVVLGPAADGGYWLIGARAPLPPSLFDGVPWSTPRTREVTMQRAAAHGLRVALVSPWYDVDGPDDLRLLAAHLAIDPTAAPATALALAALNASAP